MAKDTKDNEKQEVPLTEWQQRNLEFLKKKQEEKREKEKLNEKKIAEKKAQFQTQKESDKDQNKKKIGPKTTQPLEGSPKEVQVQKPAKTKKPKKKKKTTGLPRKDYWQAFAVITISVLVLLFSLFMISPFSRQKVLAVSGHKNAIESQLIKESGIKKTDYITSLIFSSHRFEQTLKSKDKWVKSARLTYQFPNRFTLVVKEYNIIAYTQTNKGYIPILENGSRVDTVNATELPDSFMTVNLDKEREVHTLVTKLAKLKKSLIKNIKTVSSANSQSTSDLLSLEMRDGNTVRVPLSEIDVKLPYYSKIKKNITSGSIVDMEVGLYSTTSDIEASLSEKKASADTESSTQSNSSAKSSDSTDTSETSSQSVTEATTSQ